MSRGSTSSMQRLERAANELLVGSCFARIEYDDYWRIGTDRDIWLLAHSIRVSTEMDIEAALRARVPTVLETVDMGIVPTAAGLFALLRRPIEAVGLDSLGVLSIRVGGDSVRAEVDADYVDWQWSVSHRKETPYTCFEIACFERENVQQMPSTT